MQCILLDIICDLIFLGRGIFSDFSYPESMAALLVVVGDMFQGYVRSDEDIRETVREIESTGLDEDISDAVREIESANRIQMDGRELQGWVPSVVALRTSIPSLQNSESVINIPLTVDLWASGHRRRPPLLNPGEIPQVLGLVLHQRSSHSARASLDGS
ncbi:hypothetical protein H4582DRAFT_2086616 [Lactarius indigo]|nr:hypothetical protein H4582DRAFT_2086603 [Lactarius indigo]KAI9430625.1 hypothetical protein H4582DRAFT_2086616 [Lactarius indigo]